MVMIPSLPLTDRTVLVVEDDCIIAEDLAEMLREAGARVVGPAESLPQAIRLTEHGEAPHVALLDIDLQGVAVFPLVVRLRAANVPMLFLTGIGCTNIPEEFADILCVAKPFGAGRIVDKVASLLSRLPASS